MSVTLFCIYIHYLSITLYTMWLSTLKVLAAQNFIKHKMTGRVDILQCILEKNAKKLKMKSQERKNIVFG